MKIMSLGYLGIEAEKPEAWAEFAEKILGTPTPGRGADGVRQIRLDERSHRIAIHPGTDGRVRHVGWELQNRGDFEEAVAELAAAHVAIERGTASDCAERGVDALVRFTDPAGFPTELYYGSAIDPAPLRVGRDGAAFVGLGHIVVGVPDLKEAEAFYTGVLGFKVSDYIDFVVAGKDISAAFLHCGDGKHHSIALATPAAGLNHLMIEVPSIDHVGHTWDLCQRGGVPIRSTLGRHSNDLMYSFYSISPNGVGLEVGAEGIRVDDERWRVRRLNVASLWGHQPGAQH
jgi:2,3-dihydroxybiphenyl 1,2-dioxygenase